MFKRILVGGVIVVVLAIAAVALFVFREPEAASGPIQAIPIASDATNTTTGSAAPTAGTAATSAATSEAAPTAGSTGSAATAEAAPTTGSAATAEAAPTAGSAASTEAVLMEIVPAESEARFVINEVLRGSPTVVTGKTTQVAGQIKIDPSNPQNTEVGIIQVNARDLTTDNDFRNRAIKNAILFTDDNEFVTFKPTSITGLPATGAVGQSYTFQMTGDLTIVTTTKPVTFDVTVTAPSETRLEGTATASVLYRDFGLNIPDSPSVDTVEDNVTLELSFVAQPVAN